MAFLYAAPKNTITREQAATMLGRLATVLGYKAGQGKVFADAGSISDWAKNDVAFVSSLISQNELAVMGGVSQTEFAPKGTYTREQAICSFGRLFGVKKSQI